MFAPECSQIKSLFKHCIPQWLVLPPKVSEDWYHNTLVLEGDYRNSTGAITTSFSAGSEFLAACSHDGAIRIWETGTGVCTAEVPQRKCELPIALAFSNDDKYLAVAYLRDTEDCGRTVHSPTLIVIYNAETGTPEANFDCIDVGIPTSTRLRLAFVPGTSNKLLLADLDKSVLKVLSMNISPRTIEQTWSTQQCGTQHSQGASFAFTANASCISILSSDFGSITSWDLESGNVQTYSLEINTRDRLVPRRYKRFIESHSRDLIYHEAAADPHELPTLQKLNVQTGKIEYLTHFMRSWTPLAYAPAVGKIAFVENSFGSIHVRARSHCPKSNDSADQQPTPTDLVVAQDGRMVLVKYLDHLKLRDLAGKAVFTSPKAEFESLNREDVYMSDDCKVIAARVVVQSHSWTLVWFPTSGRELQLPGMGVWACPPVVSGDGKVMAFCSRATTDSPDEIVEEGQSIDSVTKECFLLWNLDSDRKVLGVDRSYDSSYGTDRMLFSDDNTTLSTNKGNFDIKTGRWNTDNLHAFSEFNRSSPISIDRSSWWLRYHAEDVLWLPEAYRPIRRVRAQFIGNTAAYVRRDSNVVVMEFAGS